MLPLAAHQDSLFYSVSKYIALLFPLDQFVQRYCDQPAGVTAMQPTICFVVFFGFVFVCMCVCVCVVGGGEGVDGGCAMMVDSGCVVQD